MGRKSRTFCGQCSGFVNENARLVIGHVDAAGIPQRTSAYRLQHCLVMLSYSRFTQPVVPNLAAAVEGFLAYRR